MSEKLFLEVPAGFEPANNCFANSRVKPLHHGTVWLIIFIKFQPKKQMEARGRFYLTKFIKKFKI